MVIPRAFEIDAEGGQDPIRIRIHYENVLPEDVTTFQGIPVTTPARTLLDVATCLDDGDLEAAVENALAHRLATTDELFSVIDRYPEHAGRERLGALLLARQNRQRRDGQ